MPELLKQTMVLATHNRAKLAEFQQQFQHRELLIEWLSLAQFTQQSVAETGLSYIENALIKARFASQISNLPALADDSGLSVEALAGAPGIHSAYYAGDAASDRQNYQKLLLQMSDEPNRRATYYCVLAWVADARDPVPKIAIGQWHGEIARQPRGQQGFGYDPIFYLPDQGCCVAQLSPQGKNKLSHRTQALQQLLAQF